MNLFESNQEKSERRAKEAIDAFFKKVYEASLFEEEFQLQEISQKYSKSVQILLRNVPRDETLRVFIKPESLFVKNLYEILSNEFGLEKRTMRFYHPRR